MTREEAIQRLYRMGRSHVGIIDENTLADNKALSMAIEALSAEAVHGGWIIEDAHTEHCSVCRYAFYTSALFAVGGNDEPNYCPNCGAKMKGGTE